MNCVIIEDNIISYKTLSNQIKTHFPNINILEIIVSKKVAIDYLKKNEKKIDFIFLDVLIEGGNGFEVLKELENYTFKVIFVSSFKKYAFQAFQENAKHYLLKPVKEKELKEAILRIEDGINKRKQISIIDKYEIITIYQDEILYLKSDGSYTEIITPNKKYLSSKNIGEFEKKMDDNLFFRIHHSYIINIEKVEKVEKGRSGIANMVNNINIPISQRRFKNFIQKINN